MGQVWAMESLPLPRTTAIPLPQEVYKHADFLGQDGDLTDFELEMISGGQGTLESS